MKPAAFKKTLLALLAVAFFISCSKSENDPLYSSCLVTKIYVEGDTAQTSNYFRYDANGNFSFWDNPGPVDYSFSFQDNKIIVRAVPPYDGNWGIYYLGADSMAYASVSYNNNVKQDSTLYFYDNQKYLVKSVRYTDAFGKDSTSMEYSNGNLARIVIYNANGTKPQATFQYNADLSKSWAYQNIGPYNNNGLYYPWLGKPNNNLISSYSSEFNGNPSPATITYSFNASGYVKDYTFNFMGTSYKTFFDYQCR